MKENLQIIGALASILALLYTTMPMTAVTVSFYIVVSLPTGWLILVGALLVLYFSR